jgi:general secretion pathway protein G
MRKEPRMADIDEKQDPEAGWTFMETIIVLAIILVLTATVGFMAVRYVGTAKTAAVKTQLESFKLALAQYYLDCGSYPSESEGLQALREKPSTGAAEKKWNGPYLEKKLPKDPWGNEYVYKNPGPDGSEFGIASLGADGLEGGVGKDADISTWGSDD